jgi:hypothetical protein
MMTELPQKTWSRETGNKKKIQSTHFERVEEADCSLPGRVRFDEESIKVLPRVPVNQGIHKVLSAETIFAIRTARTGQRRGTSRKSRDAKKRRKKKEKKDIRSQEIVALRPKMS